jgi:ribosomal protein L7/L12
MNYYATAIDVLSKCSSSELLLFEVAKKNPGAIISAYERMNGPLIESKIKAMAQAGTSKIMCIKEYRFLTGAGLKDAKEAVERIHNFRPLT